MHGSKCLASIASTSTWLNRTRALQELAEALPDYAYDGKKSVNPRWTGRPSVAGRTPEESAATAGIATEPVLLSNRLQGYDAQDVAKIAGNAG